jgi:hypothetical protein
VAILCVVNGSSEVELPSNVPITVRQTHLKTGWSGGIGYSRAQFDAPFFWRIQDDLTVSPTCPRRLWTRFADEPKLAALTPLALTEDGLVTKSSCGGVLGPDGTMESWYPPDPMELDDPDHLRG